MKRRDVPSAEIMHRIQARKALVYEAVREHNKYLQPSLYLSRNFTASKLFTSSPSLLKGTELRRNQGGELMD